MEDKNKEVQLKEEEAEKVSGGVVLFTNSGSAPKTAAYILKSDEESDQQDEVGTALF